MADKFCAALVLSNVEVIASIFVDTHFTHWSMSIRCLENEKPNSLHILSNHIHN